MKAISLLFYCALIVNLVRAVNVDADLEDDISKQAVAVAKVPIALVPKSELEDLLTDDPSNDTGGYGNITLVLIPPPPRFLFSFAKGPRDYLVDRKFTSFFLKLQKLVKGTGIDEESFLEEADGLKYQHTFLKNLLTKGSKKIVVDNDGVVEMFNTTAYYYLLMRYHHAIFRKKEQNEFDKYDTNCVLLLMDQIAFEVSLITFLGFNGTFTLNPKVNDLQEKLRTTKDYVRSLELRLGGVFLDRSQVFEFNIRAFTRIKRLLENLEKFIDEYSGKVVETEPAQNTAGTGNEPTPIIGGTENEASLNTGGPGNEASLNTGEPGKEVTPETGDTAAIVARSLIPDADLDSKAEVLFSKVLPAVSLPYESIGDFSLRLDELLERAPNMDFADLEAEFDIIKTDFKQMELQSVRWSKTSVPYEDLEKSLAKLDYLNQIYQEKEQWGNDNPEFRFSRDDS